jgi:hypothetical protein
MNDKYDNIHGLDQFDRGCVSGYYRRAGFKGDY